MPHRRPSLLLALLLLLAGFAGGYGIGETCRRAESQRLQQEVRHLREQELRSRQRTEQPWREADRLRKELGLDQAPYTEGGPSDDG